MKILIKKLMLIIILLFLFIQPAKGLFGQESAVYAKADTQTQKIAVINNTPITNFYNFTPSSGNVKALVFMVEFADVSFEDGKQNESERVLSRKELEKAMFGNADKTSANYPYESVKAYYERASYNKLHLTGSVLYYKAKYNRDHYDTLLYSEEKDASRGYEELMMEAIAAYQESMDFTEYDSNSDGVIDAIYLSVPLNGTTDDNTWWGNQTTWWVNPNYRVDNEKINEYVILDGQPLDDNIEYYNQVCIHETGHLMGLSDYYHSNLSENDNWEGFLGAAGHDIMDEMYGDHNSFSKIMCGWIDDEEVQIADFSKLKSTYLLKPCEESPSALIIPIKKWSNNFCSEYYLVEYDKGTLNNTGLLKKSGIRIWHVDASLTKDWWNNGYSMFAYDQNITGSQRTILSLMGEKNNYEFYRTGDIFSAKSDSNAIYHVKKNATVKEVSINFTIKIGKLTKNGYSISVIRK